MEDVQGWPYDKDRCYDCNRRLDRPAFEFCNEKHVHADADVAQLIVAAIEADLRDRQGLRQEFEQCDEDIQDEIRDTWADIVRGCLTLHQKE